MLTPQRVPGRAADLYQQTTKIGWHFVDTRGYPTWQARRTPCRASRPMPCKALWLYPSWRRSQSRNICPQDAGQADSGDSMEQACRE
jgi:hypothetical protein